MNVQRFYTAFEQMRSENLGKQFERRELGLLALQYGIYIDSTMWACGLNSLFRVGRIGPKYVYSFKNTVTSQQEVINVSDKMTEYRHNTARIIEHAKAILRRHNIYQID